MMRKTRKLRGYKEANDEEDDGGRKYDVRDKIQSERFSEIGDHLQELSGNELKLKLIQRNGFCKPILIEQPNGLDLRVPQKVFTVRDVRDCVGGDRVIDVMDVRTQKNIEMSMRDWCKYYETKRRDKLLNVISLEFSHTELDDMVEAPSIVRLLDWVDQVWPKFLKESQTESTNKIDKMKYPKVQKYCLMSVKGSYTDFHIDFGGTSVWYHILKGKKIFWMVPPTELNLTTFEEWTLSGMQQDVFFGDLVEECFRIELTAGNTFFIPSGWIHAVYTLEDSLVFGGNFLHSFAIENQLKVSRVEDATKVPVKFRFPFYTEILWYVVQHYVHCLTGNDHLHPSSKISNQTTPEKAIKSSKPICDSKSTKNRNRDDDETATGSEIEESDTKQKTKKRALNSSGTKSKTKRPKAGAKGRLKKKLNELHSDDETEQDETEDDDDEDTEVDSDAEPASKSKPPTTCRMTKNSLLRLQYEVGQADDKSLASKSIERDKSPARANSVGKLGSNNDSSSPPSKHPFDLDKFMYSQDDTKINGWSSALETSNNQASWSNPNPESKDDNKIHLTKHELNGLKLLVKHLSKLSGAKKHLPSLIRNSRSLLDDCKKVINEHENDDPELAITDRPITLETMKYKKSDINDLIDQFFKPTQTNAHNELQQLASPLSGSEPRAKSSTGAESPKIDEKKSCSINAIESSSAYRKDTKGLSSPKKLSTATSASVSLATSSSPGANATATGTSMTNSTNQPLRPKSPPTRPLSNNQYSSKIKKDNSLVLPGSFADLIAATSTEKKVFDVSATDVTSVLFGTKEANRHASRQAAAATATNQKSTPKMDPLDLLSMDSPATPNESPAAVKQAAQDIAKDRQSIRANSPEPPKMSPPKRFINPSFKPQHKEKLIFASAPYVSPVSATQTKHYPWQSPAPQPQQIVQQYPATQHKQQSPVTSQLSQAPKSHDQPKVSPPTPSVNIHEPSGSARDKSQRDTQLCYNQETDSNSKVKSHEQSLSAAAAAAAVAAASPEKKTNQPAEPVSVQSKPSSASSSSSDLKPHEQANPKQSDQSNDSEEQKAKKAHKPRGPPKKSKEARQAIISSPPRPIVTNAQQRYLITQGNGLPMMAGASAPMLIAAAQVPSTLQAGFSTTGTQVDTKKQQVAKKSKKQKDNQQTSPNSSSGQASQPAAQQSIVCGLVGPPVANQATGGGAALNPKPTQQYLISRPLLFNTMPALSAAQVQKLPRGPISIFPNAMPTPLGLAATQPGTRIVWATQPRLGPTLPASVAATTSSVNIAPNSVRPTTARPAGASANLVPTPAAAQPKMVAKPKASIAGAKQVADNAALLSLATTALSTAPLPTTAPSLSYLGGIRPPTGQAIMVSSATGQPALLTGQPFFSPFMPRLPLAGAYHGLLANAPMPGSPMSATRPTILPSTGPRPAGQLVFARLPNQGQPRYIITQPLMQPRGHNPTATAAAAAVGASQSPSNQPLAFAAFRPPCPAASNSSSKDGMKAKKVKTR